MWVCHCKSVTDRQIRSAIKSGARTTGEIGTYCRAGTGCGGCLPEVCRLLDDTLTSMAYYASCNDCPLGLEGDSEQLLSA